MKKLIPFMVLMTGGCMTSAEGERTGAANDDAPVHGAGRCDAGSIASLIGRPASPKLGADALSLTGARTIRWIRPGDIVTMDYRTDRLNIELDDQGRVTRIRCG